MKVTISKDATLKQKFSFYIEKFMFSNAPLIIQGVLSFIIVCLIFMWALGGNK